MDRSAVISDCGFYRYRLDRRFGDGPCVMFLMVNPSTADATIDDATIRKCVGFAGRWGFGRIVVGNKFAFRATDVKELRKITDPVGPENNEHLRLMMTESDMVVAAWGSLSKLPETLRSRWKDIVTMADAAQRDLAAIGICADGHPMHPLMPAYREWHDWSVPWFANRATLPTEGPAR